MSAEQSIGKLFVEVTARTATLTAQLNDAKNGITRSSKEMQTELDKVKITINNQVAKMSLSEVANLQKQLKAKFDEQIKLNVSHFELEQTKMQLDQVTAKLQGMGGTVEKESGLMQSSFMKIGVAIAAAFSVEKIKEFLVHAFESAAKFEEMEKHFKGTAADMALFHKATADTVKDADLVRLSNQASDLGVNLKQQPILFLLAKESAEAYGTTTEEGMGKITMASEGNVKALKSLGIQKAVYNNLVKEGAALAGDNFKNLDAETQKQIRLDAILKASGLTMDEVNNKTKSMADRIEGIGVIYDRVAIKIGTALVKIAEYFMPYESNLIRVNEKSAETRTEFETLATTILRLGEQQNKTTGETEAYNTAITQMDADFGTHLESLSKEKDAYHNIATAIDEASKALYEKARADAVIATSKDWMTEATERTKKLIKNEYDLSAAQIKLKELQGKDYQNADIGTAKAKEYGQASIAVDSITHAIEADKAYIADRANWITNIKSQNAELFKPEIKPLPGGGGGGGTKSDSPVGDLIANYNTISDLNSLQHESNLQNIEDTLNAADALLKQNLSLKDKVDLLFLVEKATKALGEADYLNARSNKYSFEDIENERLKLKKSNQPGEKAEHKKDDTIKLLKENDVVVEAGKQAAGSIAAAWQNSFDEMLRGTMNIGEGMTSVFRGMANSIISELESIIAKWLAMKSIMFIGSMIPGLGGLAAIGGTAAGTAIGGGMAGGIDTGKVNANPTTGLAQINTSIQALNKNLNSGGAGNSSNVNISLQGKVSGEDIYFVNKKATQVQSRYS